MSTVGASTGAIVAAAKAEQMRQEEEELTKYTQEDLTNWEFKILRANKIGGFKSEFELKKALSEEALSGWQLVEKFDDYRLRLKRKISDKEKENSLGIDPYRTIYGMSNIAMFAFVLGSVFGFTIILTVIISSFVGF